MKNEIERLKEFHITYGAPCRDVFELIPREEFELRQRLLKEEMDEIAEGYEKGDLIEIADGITDCLYILLGTAVQFGVADKLQACFDEVHRSNMSKLGEDGRPIIRDDGKILKGPNYFRPDLKSIIEENKCI